MLVGWTDVTITSFLIFLLQYKTAVVGKMNGWPYTYMTLARVSALPAHYIPAPFAVSVTENVNA